ncbi:hypothetical protein [Vibrio cyclitrophicus]|uniref:COG3904 family protein n=1 Tax=Vibrio cyclitrophicus TaxID=47951 RepID=UPI000C85DA56|nr:hypothetical protein [Vibrio cyclitrophicus]PMF39490.1 hypothetical protein BCV14_07110 [Vibrio cyclitrophicus]
MTSQKIISITTSLLLLGCSHITDTHQNSSASSSSPKIEVGEDVLKEQKKTQALSSKNSSLPKSNTQNKPKSKKITNSKTQSNKRESKLDDTLKPSETRVKPNTPPSKKEPIKENDKNKTPPSKGQIKTKQQEAPSFKFPEFYAPEKYKHPLRNSKNLTFMIGEDSQGSYLYGEGPIVPGAYNKFLKYVEHYKSLGVNLERLMLHSPGGVLNEGIKIGEYLLDNNWTTDADKYMRCYSTCGFIYAAGIDKRIQTNAEIGFHRPYLPQVEDTPEFIQQVYNEYRGYWQAIGGSPELYNKFMRGYGREDMYILNTKNIKKYMHVEKY